LYYQTETCHLLNGKKKSFKGVFQGRGTFIQRAVGRICQLGSERSGGTVERSDEGI
jgi:hypothetical protein